ncbi:MAG: SDR family oxidoreductase [Chloroflexaceae bacterium]|nr:SDR family oxidoreductase [Chloroflexaceae bacterium]
MRYDGKITLVTGGSKGIGEGCVRVFADAGATVVFCARNVQEGHALEAELNAKRPNSAWFIKCDVSNMDEIEAMIHAVVAKYGRIDCLINNAGWHPPTRTIDQFSIQDFRDLLEATTYVATKGAITAFTKALAIDEASYDVRVNSVSPGNIYTPLWQAGIDASADPAATRAIGDAAQLMGRMGTIEEAGKLCLFIAAEATFTTGVDHYLSGGAELSYGHKTRKGAMGPSW